MTVSPVHLHFSEALANLVNRGKTFLGKE